MRFDLTDEQQLLRDTVRDLVAQLFSHSQLKTALLDAGAPVRVDGWNALTDLGLTSLLIPTEAGGSGGCVTDACVVAEELGRGAAPVPFVGSAITVPTLLVTCGGTSDAIAAVADGTLTAAPLVGADLSWPSPSPHVAWDWLEGASGVAVVDGAATLVSTEDAKLVERVVDPLHPLAIIPDAPLGQVELTEGLRRVASTTRVGLAAFLLGLAQTALDTAVQYAREREQYGRPIGSFQAVQHMCADMLVDVETSRSIVYGASWAVEHAPLAEAERTAAASLLWTGRAAVNVCEISIQVLGGIGVTEEHPAHLRLRSAHLFASSYGGTEGAADLLARRKLDLLTKG